MGRQVADEALIEALKTSPILSALKPDELLALAKVAEIEDFPPLDGFSKWIPKRPVSCFGVFRAELQQTICML